MSDARMKLLVEKESEVRNLRVLYMQELEAREEAARTVSALEERVPASETEYDATLKNAAYVLSLTKECLAREIRSACENIARCDLLTPHDGGELGEICGFAISLPATQSEKQPYLLLSRNGASYTMEIGRTVQGNIRRFSNFFAAFGKQADAKRRTLDEEKARLAALKHQLSSPLVYDKKLAAAKTEYDSLIEDMRENIYAQ